MFDTMTMTKTVGAVCGSLLVFLLGGWAAESLYHVGPSGGHGGEEGELHQAYVIDTGAEEAPEGEAEAGPDFATLMASADAAPGEKVFAKCKSCRHQDVFRRSSQGRRPRERDCLSGDHHALIRSIRPDRTRTARAHGDGRFFLALSCRRLTQSQLEASTACELA